MVHLSDSSVEKSSTLQMNQEEEPFLVIYNGDTYDLRKFVDVHPGGTEILQEYRNQDITDLMSNKDIHVHSPMAFDYLKSMKVRKQYDIRSEPSSELTKSGSFGDRSSPSHVFDVERPLLWQLWTNERITKEDYLQMTHTPILSQKSHRLFENNYLEFPTQLQQISHLFHLDELSEKHILRPPLAIRAAIAYIEQITTQKRRVAALNMWKKTDAIAHREQADRYYQQFWAEQEWIKELERLRRVNFYDLVSVPWIV